MVGCRVGKMVVVWGGIRWEEGSVLVTVVASQIEYVVGLLAKQVCWESVD